MTKKKKQVINVEAEPLETETPKQDFKILEAFKALEVPKQDFKVLVVLAPSLEEHLKFREQLLAAVERNMRGFSFDLDVSDEHRLGWGHVVNDLNRSVEKMLSEGYDYMWIVEADTIPPDNAFTELLRDDVDLASAVIPFHKMQNVKANAVYSRFAIAARVEVPDALGPFHLIRLDEVKGRKISDPCTLYSSTGCFLTKRRVWEAGLRFKYFEGGSGFDMILWRDIRMAGFSAVLNGNVVCEHPGE